MIRSKGFKVISIPSPILMVLDICPCTKRLIWNEITPFTVMLLIHTFDIIGLLKQIPISNDIPLICWNIFSLVTHGRFNKCQQYALRESNFDGTLHRSYLCKTNLVIALLVKSICFFQDNGNIRLWPCPKQCSSCECNKDQVISSVTRIALA